MRTKGLAFGRDGRSGRRFGYGVAAFTARVSISPHKGLCVHGQAFLDDDVPGVRISLLKNGTCNKPTCSSLKCNLPVITHLRRRPHPLRYY
jgi:hypothetical protein